jgi:2-polyprenyl-6-hydroxyphenyl methylase/3-demethylubiquinone-9 3-methyltransferase
MIWLLEYILRQIPCGIHDWQKFIKPEYLVELMEKQGFVDFEIKGFNVLGETISENIQAYLYYQKNKNFRITISDNTSLMYIGKAVKAEMPS